MHTAIQNHVTWLTECKTMSHNIMWHNPTHKQPSKQAIIQSKRNIICTCVDTYMHTSIRTYDIIWPHVYAHNHRMMQPVRCHTKILVPWNCSEKIADLGIPEDPKEIGDLGLCILFLSRFNTSNEKSFSKPSGKRLHWSEVNETVNADHIVLWCTLCVAVHTVSMLAGHTKGAWTEFFYSWNY